MHFFEKKSAKSLPVQKLLVPLQPQISREAFAQMAESVDALVSNTSGAIHPGSIPGLGTKSCKSKDLWLFFLFPTDFTDYTDIFFDTKNLNLCKSVRSVGQKRVKKDPKDYLLFFILYNPTNQDTSSLTLSTHLQEYDLPLSPNSQ